MKFNKYGIAIILKTKYSLKHSPLLPSGAVLIDELPIKDRAILFHMHYNNAMKQYVNRIEHFDFPK